MEVLTANQKTENSLETTVARPSEASRWQHISSLKDVDMSVSVDLAVHKIELGFL